jgi:carbon storage regulator
MLVLSRKNGESVWIDGMIRVEVLGVKGGRVKLGFSAPADVDIQREEIRRTRPTLVESWCSYSAVSAGLF